MTPIQNMTTTPASNSTIFVAGNITAPPQLEPSADLVRYFYVAIPVTTVSMVIPLLANKIFGLLAKTLFLGYGAFFYQFQILKFFFFMLYISLTIDVFLCLMIGTFLTIVEAYLYKPCMRRKVFYASPRRLAHSNFDNSFKFLVLYAWNWKILILEISVPFLFIAFIFIDWPTQVFVFAAFHLIGWLALQYFKWKRWRQNYLDKRGALGFDDFILIYGKDWRRNKR